MTRLINDNDDKIVDMDVWDICDELLNITVITLLGACVKETENENETRNGKGGRKHKRDQDSGTRIMVNY